MLLSLISILYSLLTLSPYLAKRFPQVKQWTKPFRPYLPVAGLVISFWALVRLFMEPWSLVLNGSLFVLVYMVALFSILLLGLIMSYWFLVRLLTKPKDLEKMENIHGARYERLLRIKQPLAAVALFSNAAVFFAVL